MVLWLTLNRRVGSACFAVPGRERRQGFLSLMPREGRGPAHVHSARLGPLASLAGAGADEIALELGEAAENRQHQASMRRRRVRPCIGQGPESSARLGHCVERVEKVARRFRQPVEPRHEQRVALGKRFKRAGQFAAIDLLGAGGAQRLHLGVDERFIFASIFRIAEPLEKHETVIDKWRGFLILFGAPESAVDGRAGDGKDLRKIADGIVAGVVHAAQLTLLLVGKLGLLAA